MDNSGQRPKPGPLARFCITLARSINAVSWYLSCVSMAAAGMMMLLIASDVFMRRAFNSPIFGAHDIIKALLVVIVFFTVAHVMRAKEHVVVDSISRLYPQKYNRVINSISYLFSMSILALIGWQSASYGLEMLRVGERLVLLKIPMSPFVFIVALGYAMFFLVVLARFILTVADMDEGAGQGPSPDGGGRG